MANRIKKSLVFRFWDNFDRPKEGCWLWKAGKSKGYGVISNGNCCMQAHRLSWVLWNGPISNGLSVLHKCDNPACVNPEHLFLGTKGDNAKDRDRKGRVAHGEKHCKAKFTEKQIKQIRQLRQQGVKVTKIAKLFNVSDGHISHIVNKDIWKRV